MIRLVKRTGVLPDLGTDRAAVIEQVRHI